MRPALGIGLTFPRKRGGGAGGGGAPYHADAVQFRVDSVLGRDPPNGLGVPAAPTGLLSVWLNTATQQTVILRSLSDGAFGLETTNNSKMIIGLSDDGFNNYIFGFFTWTEFDSNWHHVLWSWNTNFAAGNRVLQCYVDDIAKVLDTSDQDGVAFSVDYPDPGWKFNEGDVVNYADCQLYAGGAFVDLTVEANRRKFISADGKPVDPAVAIAAFGNPAIVFSGDATGFPVNQGTGGAFDQFGTTLDNASTSPSD